MKERVEVDLHVRVDLRRSSWLRDDRRELEEFVAAIANHPVCCGAAQEEYRESRAVT